jgi:ABC-type nickel/cobalt efflux system permease component RcnA
LVISLVLIGHLKTYNRFDTLVVAGMFITACLWGLSLTLRPNWWRKLISEDAQGYKKQSSLQTRDFCGHHPDCNRFKHHRVTIGGKILCAGCLGLATGSIVVIVLTIVQVVTVAEWPYYLSYFLIFLGFLMTAFALGEIILPHRHVIVHMLSNVILVVSFFLITMGVFQLTGDTVYAGITMVFSFLWIDTRIQLSRWHHKRICAGCPESCKMY